MFYKNTFLNFILSSYNIYFVLINYAFIMYEIKLWIFFLKILSIVVIHECKLNYHILKFITIKKINTNCLENSHFDYIFFAIQILINVLNYVSLVKRLSVLYLLFLKKFLKMK